MDDAPRKENDVNRLLRMSMELRNFNQPSMASEVYHIAKRLQVLTERARRVCDNSTPSRMLDSLQDALSDMGR